MFNKGGTNLMYLILHKLVQDLLAYLENMNCKLRAMVCYVVEVGRLWSLQGIWKVMIWDALCKAEKGDFSVLLITIIMNLVKYVALSRFFLFHCVFVCIWGSWWFRKVCTTTIECASRVDNVNTHGLVLCLKMS